MRWLCVILLAGCAVQPPLEASLDLSELLASPQTTFTRADKPRQFRFPEDHGPHPDFATEWWYFTGNLKTPQDRRFGYELTFFRRALQREEGKSKWTPRNAWLAHLALTDAQANRFLFEERFSRDNLGLAGATPTRVWLEDWEVNGDRLTAKGKEITLDLKLEPLKPPVLQGENGLSRKGDQPGEASYYYSVSRIKTTGTVQNLTVEGTSWMDREWSSQPLADDLAGWDWFALQLDDGTELMLYQLRKKDGTASPHSRATVIGQSPRPVPFELTPEKGDPYPVSWTLKADGKTLKVTPLIPDQELKLSIRYWEGAVVVSGDATGRGYLEMVGYK